MKNLFKNLTPRQWLIFLIVVAVLVYFLIIEPAGEQKPGTVVTVPVPNANKTTTGGSTGGSTGGAVLMYTGVPLPYTFTPKEYFTLSKNVSVYGDTFNQDYISNGLRKIDANGRTYTAFYWINEIPFQNPDGTPKDFTNVTLPPGCFITVRKVYLQSDWVSTFDEYFTKPDQAWYEYGYADENRTFKTVVLNITT